MKTIPTNFGKRWDEWDRRLLVDMLAEGKPLKTIAYHLKRTIGAIESRVRILKSFEDACGTCVIEQEVLNTRSITDIAKIFGAEANKVAFNKGELSIEEMLFDPKLVLEYKLLVSKTGEVYVKFRGFIPIDVNNPRIKSVEIKAMKK